MMKQFLEIKSGHPDEILLFRMGDFYETFFEDARTVSRVLGIALTSRSKGEKGKIPLAGFPYHALDVYLAKLVKAGLRVAVCEQTEDPSKAKGLVKREVVEVITPGTLLGETVLDERKTVLLCAAHVEKGKSGLAFCDLSTGEVDATEMEASLLGQEIARRNPSELLLPEGFQLQPPAGCGLTFLERWKFDVDSASGAVESMLGFTTIEGLGAGKDGMALGAVGAILSYVRDTKGSGVAHLVFTGIYRREKNLIIDRGSSRALALTEETGDDGDASLARATDCTVTPAGTREWKKWLLAPPRNPDTITDRYDAVSWFVENPGALGRVREALDKVTDLQRHAGKLGTSKSSPRDLRAIADTLGLLPSLTEMLRGAESGLLRNMASVDLLKETRGKIDSMLLEEPSMRAGDGGVIMKGVSPELDEYRDVRAGGREWIKSRVDAERKRTGIPNLTIGHNKVFGYYIEVSKSHLDKVPEDYTRKQTLVGAERFITPQLKEMEARIYRAGEEIERLEKEIFVRLREEVAEKIDGIRAAGKMLAGLDVLASLATMALERGYVRPRLESTPGIIIEDGRHPVLDKLLPPGECVPNSLTLDQGRRILLVTGPNMAGKSTYLRQAALLVIMAQAGSFVPASSMRYHPVDRIFTRIGSSDRITRGQSTFLLEMAEAAALLNSGTAESLAILDEVGRGTSTYDGLSLAWAMVEYLHDDPRHRPLVLFATHYHELTALGSLLPAVGNVNVKVEKNGGKVVFLYRVEDGSTDESYGIHVASMAGVPPKVVRRARKVLADLEAGRHLMPGGMADDQLELPFQDGSGSGENDFLREKLRKIDPDELTPRKALEVLYELRDSLE